MNKRVSLLVLFIILGFTRSIGQNLDLDYVNNWLKKSNTEYKPELVRDFFINGSYQKLNSIDQFNQILKKIKTEDVNSITFSAINSCGYNSGKGEIFILTKTEKTQAEIKELIAFGTEIYDIQNPMILVVDNKILKGITLSKLLMELDLSKIYDIAVSPYPVPEEIYGSNAQNGIIKVWKQ